MKRSVNLKTAKETNKNRREKKRTAKIEKSLSNLWDNVKQSDICVIRIKRERRKVRNSS